MEKELEATICIEIGVVGAGGIEWIGETAVASTQVVAADRLEVHPDLA